MSKVEQPQVEPPVIAVNEDSYAVQVCEHGHVHVYFENGTELEFTDPDDAYDFARKLSLAYDEATQPTPQMFHGRPTV